MWSLLHPFNKILKSVNFEFCSDACPHVVYSSHTTLESNPHVHFQNGQNKAKPGDNAGVKEVVMPAPRC